MTREPTEMELRVAEVLKEAIGKALDATSISTRHGDWTAIGGGSIDLVDLASAAIRAMREPTADVVEAGHTGSQDSSGNMSDACGFPPHLIPYCWNAMIDAASPPEEKS